MTARIHWRVSMLATAFPLGAAVFFLLILTGCDGNGEQGQRGRDRDARVAVTTAETDRIVHSLDATAEVVPTHRVEISTTVEGPLDFFPW
ncbi:MAG: hypothetical protein ACLFU6_14645, partial [Candidatus Hydrogenedentota bacterium]